MTGEDLGYKPEVVEKAKFEYSPLGKVFNKDWMKKTKRRTFESLKNIESKNEEQLEAIKYQGEKQLNEIKKQKKNQLKAMEKYDRIKDIVYLKKE